MATFRREGGHWLGQPLLVTVNSYDVGLLNGDTGVVLPLPGGALGAVFPGDGPREGPVITECWYESYPEATGLRLVFHVAAENLLKEGAKADKAARAPRMPGANGVLQAAVVSLAGLVAQQPLSTPTSRQAKDMPVTNGGPETVGYAAYTHGGGRGPGNSVAGYDGKDPGMELVNAAVAAALDGAGAVTLYDVGDLVEHGDEVRGDGVYSGRLKLSPQFPTCLLYTSPSPRDS